MDDGVALPPSALFEPACSPEATAEAKRLRVVSPHTAAEAAGVGGSAAAAARRAELLELIHNSLSELGLNHSAAALEVRVCRVLRARPSVC